jgi:hypothetical protein
MRRYATLALSTTRATPKEVSIMAHTFHHSPLTPHKRSPRKQHARAQALVSRLHKLDHLSTTQAALLQDAYATLAASPQIQSAIALHETTEV